MQNIKGEPEETFVVVRIPPGLQLDKDDFFLIAHRLSENGTTVTGGVKVTSTDTREKIAYQINAGELRIKKIPKQGICFPIATMISTTALERSQQE